MTAMKLGRRLHWDPEKEKSVRREHANRKMTDVGEDDEANKMLDYEHREPYLT